jgi:hypothetical protein
MNHPPKRCCTGHRHLSWEVHHPNDHPQKVDVSIDGLEHEFPWKTSAKSHDLIKSHVVFFYTWNPSKTPINIYLEWDRLCGCHSKTPAEVEENYAMPLNPIWQLGHRQRWTHGGPTENDFGIRGHIHHTYGIIWIIYISMHMIVL